MFDTNIVIDHLCGRKEAQEELSRYSEIAISPITWMEVLVGAKSPDETHEVEAVLSQFELFNIDRNVSRKAVEIRKNRGIKLPDAIIQATAMTHSALLITRNTKDFPVTLPFVHVPYEF